MGTFKNISIPKSITSTSTYIQVHNKYLHSKLVILSDFTDSSQAIKKRSDPPAAIMLSVLILLPTIMCAASAISDSKQTAQTTV